MTLPPIKFPPDKDQKSWPQVEFSNPESVRAFVESHHYGVLNGTERERPITYLGWLSAPQVFRFVLDDRGNEGPVCIVVSSDRYEGNLDPKMPDDAGWVWYWEVKEPYRVLRAKADSAVRPVRRAELKVL